MKYTDDVPEYVIDLKMPEKDRWKHVIRKERRTTQQLFDQALSEFEYFPGCNRLLKPFKKVLRSTYWMRGGLYLNEMKAWAEGLERPLDDVILLQCTYELNHAGEAIVAPFGCTAGIHNFPKHGMVHVRNMDWPLSKIGPATRVFRFVKDTREFIVVGVPGLMGVLSGMLPKAYSVTINYAPTSSIPSFGFGPLFLLRDVLENCDSYEEAVAYLQHTELSSSVFYTVCGAEKGQGCVIERTKTDALVRRYRSEPLCQANHYVGRRFSVHNKPIKVEDEDEGSVFEGSRQRWQVMKDALAGADRGSSLMDISRVLDVEPVLNEDSHQQMVFCPASGKYAVWRTH